MMEAPKIFESEYRFCLILWDNEPVASGRLVQLAKDALGWSNATTYTVIRRLSERGILKDENAIVYSLVSKAQAQQAQLEELLEKTFENSVPALLTAVANSGRLSEGDARQLVEMIGHYTEA